MSDDVLGGWKRVPPREATDDPGEMRVNISFGSSYYTRVLGRARVRDDDWRRALGDALAYFLEHMHRDALADEPP